MSKNGENDAKCTALFILGNYKEQSPFVMHYDTNQNWVGRKCLNHRTKRTIEFLFSS